ncbi:hypothetical protein OH76DRAFT_552522 [Lentinus brumalis]|uniref:Uncharacterized protein n=1 Tax=Lentinus brumalis TaxID=2498619 RepID=A0A371CHE8_9APHY|nr:hypothetical protein OH76DRAFT_552522 [Polyporus brumalis]
MSPIARVPELRLEDRGEARACRCVRDTSGSRTSSDSIHFRVHGKSSHTPRSSVRRDMAAGSSVSALRSRPSSRMNSRSSSTAIPVPCNMASRTSGSGSGSRCTDTGERRTGLRTRTAGAGGEETAHGHTPSAEGPWACGGHTREVFSGCTAHAANHTVARQVQRRSHSLCRSRRVCCRAFENSDGDSMVSRWRGRLPCTLDWTVSRPTCRADCRQGCFGDLHGSEGCAAPPLPVVVVLARLR